MTQADQKYRCAVCKKMFLSRVRPPQKWQNQIKLPDLKPGESIHICGMDLMKEGPFVCGQECLEKAKEQITGALSGIEEDLAVIRSKE